MITKPVNPTTYSSSNRTFLTEHIRNFFARPCANGMPAGKPQQPIPFEPNHAPHHHIPCGHLFIPPLINFAKSFANKIFRHNMTWFICLLRQIGAASVLQQILDEYFIILHLQGSAEKSFMFEFSLLIAAHWPRQTMHSLTAQTGIFLTEISRNFFARPSTLRTYLVTKDCISVWLNQHQLLRSCHRYVMLLSIIF